MTFTVRTSLRFTATPRVQTPDIRTKIQRKYTELSRPVQNCPGTITIGPGYARVLVCMASSDVHVPYCTEMWVVLRYKPPPNGAYGHIWPSTARESDRMHVTVIQIESIDSYAPPDMLITIGV